MANYRSTLRERIKLYENSRENPLEDLSNLVVGNQPWNTVNPKHFFSESARTYNSLLERVTSYLYHHGQISGTRLQLKSNIESRFEEAPLKRIEYEKRLVERNKRSPSEITNLFETLNSDSLKLMFLRGVWAYRSDDQIIQSIPWMKPQEVIELYLKKCVEGYKSDLRKFSPDRRYSQEEIRSLNRGLTSEQEVYKRINATKSNIRRKFTRLLKPLAPGTQTELFSPQNQPDIRDEIEKLKPHEQRLIMDLFGNQIRKQL